MTATVVKAENGKCVVFDGENYISCSVRGKMRNRSGFPKSGDRVEYVYNGEIAVITDICKRKNNFSRPSVANIDIMFIVVSVTNPEPVIENIDKMTLICEANNVEPVIVFSKTDLKSADELVKIYKSTGYEIILSDDRCCERIAELTENKIAVFTGFSGVGKSSLINRLMKNNVAEVGELSEHSGRGKNTTRNVSLYRFGNSWIADTPGFSSLDLLLCTDIEKEDVACMFPEFGKYSEKCRFASCSHSPEIMGCKVYEAVKKGEISASRYNNYLKFYGLYSKKIKKY